MKEMITIRGADIVELSMAFAQEILPETMRPFEVRSCITPDQDRSVNFDCFRILTAVAFESGWKFLCSRPMASIGEIACAAIDYTQEHNLGHNKKKLEFYQNCFREGVRACKQYLHNN